jgi:predicted PurR-regulated permease PerM
MRWAPDIKHRFLIFAVIIALIFGVYFLWPYFSVIIFAMIMAYLFHPIYGWMLKKTKKPGLAAALTCIVNLLVLVIPFVLTIFLTILQVESLVRVFTDGQTVSLGDINNNVLSWINDLLARLPGSYQIDQADLQDAFTKALSTISQNLLGILTSSVSGVGNFLVQIILYIYLLANMLRYSESIIRTMRQLNPLGVKANNAYVEKMGAMTSGMVRGQFVIAFCQGLISAAALYIAGLHDVFFFLVILLTVFSIIPLGAGIIVVPIGVIMLATGHIWQGVFVLLVHFLVASNIDNLLRPRLVPKSARLNSALTILAVFAGVAMFGFLGIVIGPVIMVLISTTVHMFLSTRASDKQVVTT